MICGGRREEGGEGGRKEGREGGRRGGREGGEGEVVTALGQKLTTAAHYTA